MSRAAVLAAAPEHATAAPTRDARDPAVRLAALADPGTLRLTGGTDGAVRAEARLAGVSTVLFATDARVQGGALGVQTCALITDAYDEALAAHRPVVGIWHSGGARLGEGARGLHGVGTVFAAMTRASGVLPQVSLVVGPAAGGAAYGPALTDVVVLDPDARVFVTGPDVVRRVTGEDADADALGGPAVHARHSGVAHVAARTSEEALDAVRRAVSLLSAGARPHAVPPPRPAADPDPSRHLPASRRRAYDVHPLVADLLDGPPLELQPAWAPNVVTALGRLHGRAVGVVATNPLRLAGCLDARSSDKAARFVRLCDAHGLPLVVLVDVPGYLPGLGQERDGVVRRGAKLVHAFAAAVVPRVTVVTRKAYGGACIALNSRSLGATRVLAWPDAEIDVMAAPAAVGVLHRRRLAGLPPEQRAEAEAGLAAEHLATTGGLARALSDGVIDEVIAPPSTRAVLAELFDAAPPARGRLTNIPL